MTVFHQILGLSVVKVGNQVVVVVVVMVGDGMIVLFVTIAWQDGNLTEVVDLLFLLMLLLRIRLGKLMQEDVVLFVVVKGFV